MAIIPSKVARAISRHQAHRPRQTQLLQPFAEAMLESYWRNEYREIARYQHLMGRQLTDTSYSYRAAHAADLIIE